MGKAILFLVVVFIAVIVGVVFMTGKAIAPKPAQTDGATEIPGDLPDPANALRGATGDLSKEIKDTAKKATSAVVGAGDKAVTLKLDRDVVEVKAGTAATIKVTRTGGTAAAKLELIPAPNSGLKASGGEFKDGDTETTVTIEVPAGMNADAGVTVKLGDAVKVVPVKVK
jgi:hypothetical protein